jgi:hypothetical protein
MVAHAKEGIRKKEFKGEGTHSSSAARVGDVASKR